jgi:hypothetical protein
VSNSSTKLGFLVSILITAALFDSNGDAAAAVFITGAVDATVNSGGTRTPTSINNTFNQAGLSAPYVSDVTLFQPYVTITTHTNLFICCEWFSLEGTTSASVTYDLGELDLIDGVALWNEEVSGIGTLDLFWSTDNSTFSPWAINLKPIDNNLGGPYSAQVFNLSPVNARYFRFDMSDCPQIPGFFPACSIGEVAFRDPDDNVVPEPTALALLGISLAALITTRRTGLLRRSHNPSISAASRRL